MLNIPLVFLHHHQELDIFRTWFLRAGFIECHGSETHYSGREDALWVLGHIKAEASYIFKNLEDYQTINTLRKSSTLSHLRYYPTHNCIIILQLHHWKSERRMPCIITCLIIHKEYPSPLILSLLGKCPPPSFSIFSFFIMIPSLRLMSWLLFFSSSRSWDINVLRQTYHHQQDLLLSSSLQGLWILKDPDIEGGYGVEVLNGSQALQLLASNETKGETLLFLLQIDVLFPLAHIHFPCFSFVCC